ncbi:MAG: SDR family NAD(P)-dependent oxidoreductase [Candidatus Binataceae bacterium]
MKLGGKVALITGAGSGIGRSAAILFAKEGARVAAADVNREAVEETARMINEDGGGAVAIAGDVSRSADVQAIVSATVEQLGAPDVLYNNAGIEGRSDFLARLSEDDFDQVIAIDLRGVFLGMKYVLPHMMRKGGGVIINAASIAGMIGLRGAASYCAAKAGVIALTRVAAVEYGRYKIRVNCICPGAIDTPMIERLARVGGVNPRDPESINRVSLLGRAGAPDEIAKVALFIASDDCSFATGAPFIIDGGWTAG